MRKKPTNRTTSSDQLQEDLSELERFVEDALKVGHRWKAEFFGLWNYNPSNKSFFPSQLGTKLLGTRLGQYGVYVGYKLTLPPLHTREGNHYKRGYGDCHYVCQYYYATVSKNERIILHLNASTGDGGISKKFSELKDLYQRVEAACKPLKWAPK